MLTVRNVLITAATAISLLAAPLAAQAADGLVTAPSSMSVADTMDKFEKFVSGKGMKIFARVNHTAGAKSVGQELRPTQLLIFGNPKGGTPLMKCSQSFAIDLPLKALVWEDEQGKVWLGVNDMDMLAKRHKATDCPAVAKVKGALGKFMAAAVK
ncbi:MAG: DUF302 domain-containing protein [Burkholderiaceae bacterium]